MGLYATNYSSCLFVCLLTHGKLTRNFVYSRERCSHKDFANMGNLWMFAIYLILGTLIINFVFKLKA